MKKAVALLIIAFLPLLACDDKEEVRLSPSEIKLTAEQIEIIQGTNSFGLDLFREVLSGEPGSENVFISPLSVHLALSMAWNGAGGATREQVSSVLRYPGIDDTGINASIKKLISDLLSVDEKVEIDIANSIWYRDGFSVENRFLDINREYFDAMVRALDFDDPSSVNVINKWVAGKTNNRINQIVDQIDKDHVMFLINAIYFNGIWAREFVRENTRERPFNLPDGKTADVMTMETEGKFGYAERQGYRVAELPYGRGNYSMLLFLPDWDEGVDGMIEKLTPEEWANLPYHLESNRLINLRLPRFSFEYETGLNNALHNLGMKDAFAPRIADFSGITRKEEIYISKVKHKSFVEVNEEGTEAAAVTSVEMRVVSYNPDEPQVTFFHVDRPFVMAIRELYTNSVIFIGRVTDPR